MTGKRKKLSYTNVTFIYSHLKPVDFSLFIDAILEDGGRLSKSKNSSNTSYGIDVPVQKHEYRKPGKDLRTRRLYIDATDTNVTVRYQIKSKSRFPIYSNAIRTIENLLREGERKVMRAEGTSYDNSSPPLILS